MSLTLLIQSNPIRMYSFRSFVTSLLFLALLPVSLMAQIGEPRHSIAVV
ncbi:MAG: hypothetical protein ACLS29_08470 [Prevotellamassilia sp.]